MAKHTKVIHHEEQFKGRLRNRALTAIREIAGEVKSEAMMKTPLKEGNLRKNILIDRENGKLSMNITWREPYAQYQERGRRANPPYHIVKKYTTLGTGAHFAENAVNKVVTIKNFKEKMQRQNF